MPARPHRPAALAAAVALAICAPALAGCTATGASGNGAVAAGRRAPAPVTIGLLAAVSGEDPAASRSAVQGAQLAADVVNVAHPALPLPLGPSAGLAGGGRVSLVVADTRGDAGVGGRAAAELLQRSHPAGLVVADSVDVAEAVGQHAEDARLPLVDAGTSADLLTELGREWYFRIGPSDRVLLSTALAALRQDFPTARRLVVLDGAGGASGAAPGAGADLSDAAQARGFTVVGRLPVTAAVDLPDRIGAQRPDAVVALVGSGPEAGLVTDVTPRLKNGVPVLTVGHRAGDAAAGAVGQRVLRAATWSADFGARNPVARAVGEMYRQRFGVPMNEVAANAFTAVLTLAVSIDRAGRTDAAAVRAALRQIDLPATDTIMPWDGVRFDNDGQNVLAAGVVERLGNGPQISYPRELAPRSGA